MTRSLLFVIFAALAVWSIIRARRTKCPPRYLLAAFWGFLALNQPPRSSSMLIAAALCLGGYWLWISIWRKNSVRDLQRMLGLSDAEIVLREEVSQKALVENRTSEARKNEAERAEALQDEAYRARPALRRVRMDIVQTAEQSFPAGEGNSLVSLPGPLSVEVEMERFEWDDGIVAYRCRTFVCDRERAEWRCETLGRTGNFLSALDDLESHAFRKWDDAPAAWVDAIKSRCVVAELTELLDSRDYHELEIGGRRFEYNEKYQMPTVDLAWLAAENSWLVRLKGIYRDVHGKEADLDEMPNIPPFAWSLPAETASVFIEPGVHVLDSEEWYDDERHRPVFSKTGRQGMAQANVILKPRAEVA